MSGDGLVVLVVLVALLILALVLLLFLKVWRLLRVHAWVTNRPRSQR